MRALLRPRVPGHQAALQLALALAILAALGVLALRSGSDRGIEIEARDPRPGIDELRVSVVGAVLRPGVVTAAPGDRVADAIAQAGGIAPDADLTAVNLARRLADEDQIVVPLIGEREPLIDINSASASELKTLPGIGPVYAAAIVAERERGGPFLTTDDLVLRGALPQHVYVNVRDLIATPEASTRAP